ncbi:MAG TPA: hypothetical protein VF771_09285, partial [Longimicrobiaceae bacterium]
HFGCTGEGRGLLARAARRQPRAPAAALRGTGKIYRNPAAVGTTRGHERRVSRCERRGVMIQTFLPSRPRRTACAALRPSLARQEGLIYLQAENNMVRGGKPTLCNWTGEEWD